MAVTNPFRQYVFGGRREECWCQFYIVCMCVCVCGGGGV